VAGVTRVAARVALLAAVVGIVGCNGGLSLPTPTPGGASSPPSATTGPTGPTGPTGGGSGPSPSESSGATAGASTTLVPVETTAPTAHWIQAGTMSKQRYGSKLLLGPL
jgi:hypothetical protein